MSLAKKIVAGLPPDLKRRARAGKRWSRRMRYRAREAVRPTKVERADIVHALKDAGSGRGTRSSSKAPCHRLASSWVAQRRYLPRSTRSSARTR